MFAPKQVDSLPVPPTSSSSVDSSSDIETLLSQCSDVVQVNKGSILEYHTASFAANEPIEDRLCSQAKDGDSLFGIYDGHGGTAAAQFAQDQLFQYVLYNVFQKVQAQAEFQKSDPQGYELVSQFKTLEDWDKFERQVGDAANGRLVRDSFDPLRAIPDAIKKAFQQADQAFLLSGVLDKQNKLQEVFSGSCLLLTYIVNNWLFVANAGDSKAVLGRRCKDQNGNYHWKAMPLSTIHTAQTEEETIIKAHPNEADAISGGRIKGYLEPSRGLGDALFKDRYFNKCLLPESQLPEPFSPPYTTAVPDVEPVRIECEEVGDSFLILASDGLWDMVSDQQAVNVVSQAVDNGQNAGSALLKKSLEMTLFDGANLTEKMASARKLPARIRRQYYDDTSIIVIFFKPNEVADVFPSIPTQTQSAPISFVHITEKLQGYMPPQSSTPS